jgi:regulator of replication initiation timing
MEPIDVAPPTPGIPEELNEKITNSTEFNIHYENANYILQIKTSGYYLYVNIREENNIMVYYESVFTLDDLCKFNKTFKTCDNLKEAFDLMISNIKENKNLIKSISENNLIFVINILQPNHTTVEKEIQLLKKYAKSEVVVEKLAKEFQEFKTSKDKFEKELSELKKENDQLKKENEQLKKDNEELKSKVNYILDDTIIKSTIIEDQSKFDFIKERLRKVYFEGKKITKLYFDLIYKAKKHGGRAKNFHTRCDAYNNTLSIIKTKAGIIFGGFTTQTWEGNSFDKQDDNAFCFSLDKQKIYNIVKGKKAIYASPDNGPTFQNCIFQIEENFFENGGTCDVLVKQYDNIEEELEINGGNQNFLVEDLEVFVVYFELEKE